ncbi:hypothetical protein EZ456_02975 [Pedobacter psychrodurus]|uniref:Uncharacterized protein n=1 Tax=Pedobacter psychrodurus TaxID=2530456 RepID=A0A4R0Q0F7_9SPHI|nr:hypothetical protein [Pedobacter psychrodurus]TCD29141.1 hypothetical protein EZ456_02975 [Pedobacter psychrodurus]
MSAVIYTVLKEFFVEVNGHAIKARIMSPINDGKVFVFKISSFYKSKTNADAYEPASTFTSYANAERHLLQYLEGIQNTLDLGGDIAPGNTF